MNFVNLTPHTIRLADSNGDVLATVEPSGDLVRVVNHRSERVEFPEDIPVPVVGYNSQQTSRMEGLPEPSRRLLENSLAPRWRRND